MFKKIKEWFDGIMQKSGITIPDDKKADFEAALKEFAESFEKDSGNDKDAATALAEAMKTALAGALPPVIKDDPAANPASPDLSKVLAEAMKPFAEKLSAIEKGLGDIEKVRKESENLGRKKKIEETLKEAHSKGRISSKQVVEYKKALEDAIEKSPESFDFSIKMISGLPDNNIIAKQNKTSGFSLDGKPVEEPAEGEKSKDGKDNRVAKSILGSVNPEFMKNVNENIQR